MNKIKIFIIIAIFLIIPFGSSLIIKNSSLGSSSYQSKVYTNTTMNLSKISITNDSLEIINLSGGGKFTNIGEDGFISFITPIPEYDDVKWDFLRRKELNVKTFTVPIRYSELVEVFKYVRSGDLGDGCGITELEELKLVIFPFIKDKKNEFFVYTKDSEGNLIDVDSLEIRIEDFEDDEFEKEIFRLREGTYIVKIIVKKEISEIKLKVLVEDESKILSQEEIVSILEETFKNKVKNKTSSFLEKLLSFFEDRSIKTIILCSLFIFGLVTFFLVLYRRKRQRKDN